MYPTHKIIALIKSIILTRWKYELKIKKKESFPHITLLVVEESGHHECFPIPILSGASCILFTEFLQSPMWPSSFPAHCP